jgi:hypothetical protein
MLKRMIAILGALWAFSVSAAEPVRTVGIYVQPYYEAAREAGSTPRVRVNKQFDALFASAKREDIVAARDGVAAKPQLVTPMTLMVLAIRLYDMGLRDDAVFWFYAAKERAIVLAQVLDMRARGLAQADEAVRSFAVLAGPVINGYAFCDLGKQREILAKAIDWVEQNPYAVMFMDRLPALPGDRPANHRRAIADARARAAKERAQLDGAKAVAAFKAARRQNGADEKYCWK